MKTGFSIIVPVLHEAPGINDLIGHLRKLEFAEQSELIVVDGSEKEATRRAITEGKVHCIPSPPGRAIQMNAGAAVAAGDILIFLHADTRLPNDALRRIGLVMEDGGVLGGAFNLGIDSPRWIYRCIAAIASLRSRLTRIPYGDQAIFIRRDIFLRLGGYPEIPIMEDVAFMRRIRQEGGRIRIIPRCVITSPRRWEQEGVLHTTLRNRLLLLAYSLGAVPVTLARYYKTGGRLTADEATPITAENKPKAGCILLFVKSPDQVPVKSRLSKAVGEEAARELYRNFVLDLLDTLSEITGKGRYDLKVCVYPSGAVEDVRRWVSSRYTCTSQHGRDLGERMSNAFRECFAAGHTRAILIGSDAPDLTSEIIEPGFARLEHSIAVIGPAHDGGYFLIGFQKESFLPAAFDGIPWSTGEVFCRTMGIFRREKLDPALLPPWWDIDTYEDLRRLRERHREGFFANSRTMRYLLSRDGT